MTPTPDATLHYRDAPLAEGSKPLSMEVFLPAGDAKATAVFFHPGGFFTGAPSEGRVFARELTDRGFAFAAPAYRLKGDNSVLSKPWAGKTRTLRQEVPDHFGLAPRFIGRPAHAATEDGLAALNWISGAGAQHGLPPKLALIGISAGGMIAANIAWLAPALGVQRPPIAASAILSGALANVARCNLNAGPALLWVHAHRDKRVPVPSADATLRAPQGRKAPTQIDILNHKAHGTWLYRGQALPGATEVEKRAAIWEFLDRHIEYQE